MEEGRRIGFAMDFSVGSIHALKWALQHMVKAGDNLILVIVNKKLNEIGEMHLWEAFGSRMLIFSLLFARTHTHTHRHTRIGL